jgi:hypothetical protein
MLINNIYASLIPVTKLLRNFNYMYTHSWFSDDGQLIN